MHRLTSALQVPRWWPMGRRRDGERGTALVFGALTLFMLACFVIFISDMAMVSSTRIQMQNAADECAYAGTLYEANICSAVAYLNEGMAFMYYDALRYCVDTAVLGTLANMKRYAEHLGHPASRNAPDSLVWSDYDDDAPGYSGSPIAAYDRAYARARDNVPEIERTLAMFSRWEWGMALSAGELVTMEVNRVALSHGIDAIAMYPDVDFFPGNGVQFDLHILKLMEGGEHVGWRVWSDDPPFYVEARRLGEFHWLITNTNRDTYEIERTNRDPQTYRIQTPKRDLTVEQTSDTHVKLDMTDQETGERTLIDARELEGLGWAVSMSNDDQAIDYVPMGRDGGYWLKVTSKQTGEVSQAGIRRDPDTGRVQQWSGSSWQDVPGQSDSVSVGGVEVNVQIDSRIHLGEGSWFNPPNTLHLPEIDYHIPNVFRMGDVWVTLMDETARIDALIRIPVPGGGRTLRFSVDESNLEEMNLYGLMGLTYNVPKSANCTWHASRDGDERDRLCRDCQLLDGECTGPAEDETEFTYQYRLGKPYFIKEDLRRFAHHAISDRDPFARANNFQYPEWTEWLDLTAGEPRGRDYYQTRALWDDRVRPNYDSDDDGELDSVRVYANDRWGLNRNDERHFDPCRQKVKPWNLDDLGQATAKFAPPVRLSEDFFFYGLTVGCWNDTRKHRTTHLTLFRNPDWGMMTFASARAGFLERQSDDPNSSNYHYRFTWDFPEDVEDFVNSGYENLYEPVWTAHLWPVTDAIRSEHIRAYVDNQTGLSYLIHGLLRTYWYEPRPPDQIGEEPRLREDVNHFLRRMHLDGDSVRIEEVIQH